MAMTLEDIREEIRQLPFDERIRLVRTLELDLDADDPADGASVDGAWEAEEERRAQEIISGNAQLLTHEDFVRRLDEVRARYPA